MDKEKNPLGRLEVKPDVAAGTYSNLAVISHSKTEFIIDFAAMLPGLPGAQVQSRIIMAPEHCKRLLGALAETYQVLVLSCQNREAQMLAAYGANHIVL